MIKDSLKTAIVITLLLLTSAVTAQDWTNWRGPNYDGSADEKNLPGAFSKTKNVKWSVVLPGPSSATPIITDGKIFLSSTDYDRETILIAMCFDQKTGKELWRKEITVEARTIPRGNMASPSPATDGKRVFFLYDSGHLLAFDYEGKELWQRNLQDEYDAISLKYGYTSSPLVYDGTLYFYLQRNTHAYRGTDRTDLDSFLLAIDPATGKNIWKKSRITDSVEESRDAYTTPLPFNSAGRKEILTSGADYVISCDAKTGDELWRYGYYLTPRDEKWRLVPSLIPAGDLVLGLRPRGNGLFAINKGGKGTLSKENIAWSYDEATPDATTPLVYKGNLYILVGKAKTLTCLDAKTGKQKWTGSLDSTSSFYAALTAADDKIYAINEAGQAFIIKAGGDSMEVLCQTDFDDKPSMASIAIADNSLFIRTASTLYCIKK
jgi:outer membrane protein assembly factor BamB